MPVIDNLNFVGTDERTRKFLLPAKIVKTDGVVLWPEKLLKKKSLQIGLSETDYTVLQNDNSGKNASILIDFGTELHGGVRLMVYHTDCKEYPEISLTFGESVSEAQSQIAEKNAGNDHAVRHFRVPAPALSDQEWGQTGFRFLKIELLTKAARISLKSVLAVFVFRDLEYKGSFSCDDEQINRIYDTAAYTCHLNLQNMVWDGIKRDRLVWIGDMMPECMTIRDIFGVIPLVEQSLSFVREQTPLPGWMCGFPSYSMWWLLILWDWYMASGDKKFLNDNREYARKLLKDLCQLVDDAGEDHITDYFLDWPTYHTPAAVSGVRALLRMALDCGVKLSEYYHEQKLADTCANRRKCLDLKREEHGDAKQAIAFLALSGATDRKDAADRIITDGISGFSSFLLYFILRAVNEGGKPNEALSLLKEYAEDMIDCGATTFWEDFNPAWKMEKDTIENVLCHEQHDIHGDCGDYCYKGFRHSLCHGWASGAVPYLTEQVMGVRIVEPGCRTLEIRPQLSGLKWVRGTFPTPFGAVKIFHERNENGTVRSRIDSPKEVCIHLIGSELFEG